MVSPNPNPQPQEFYIDPLTMGLPALGAPPNPPARGSALPTTASKTVMSSEDPIKKVRKPYTITKSRESWTEQEHEKFLEALQLFDRDWKKIEAFVGSKTVIQIRSHAQKYFMKVQKNGTSEHVPPPRPKRKAAHPYPHKVSQNASIISQVKGEFPSSAALVEPGYVYKPDSLSVPRTPVTSASLSSWNYSNLPPVSLSHAAKENIGLTMPHMRPDYSYSSSNESTQQIWPASGLNDLAKGKRNKRVRVIPDFAQVYSFIGSVFDPNASGHLQKLKEMDPINIETALLLMKNLSANLMSPEFEDHRRLLLSYEFTTEKAKFSSNLHADKPDTAIPSM